MKTKKQVEGLVDACKRAISNTNDPKIVAVFEEKITAFKEVLEN